MKDGNGNKVNLESYKLWQQEFDRLRLSNPSKLNWLVNSKLRIPPRWFPINSAFVILFFVCIDRNLLSAPEHTRKYILAHEYGHIVKGHAASTFIGICVIIFSGFTIGSLLGLSSSLMLVVYFMWKNSVTREIEADTFSVSAVGKRNTINGFSWMVNWDKRGLTKYRVRRLNALLCTQDE